MIDDWVDLEAPVKAQARKEPVVFGTVTLRHGAVRATFSIDEALIADIGWPRYRIAWNASRKQFRITGAKDGAFEGSWAARGPKAKAGDGGGRRMLLRAPLPADLVAAEGRCAPAFTADRAGHSLTVTIPSRFWAKKP